MKRRSPPDRRRAAHPDPVPHDFRERLELTRLHLRALFRTLDLLHLAQELARRCSLWTPPPLPARGWARLYCEHVQQANLGADLDFLGTAD